MIAEIHQLFDQRRCFREAECGMGKRTRLSDGSFFPAPYTWVGSGYECTPKINGGNIPRILVFSGWRKNRLKFDPMEKFDARNCLVPGHLPDNFASKYAEFSAVAVLANLFIAAYLGNREFVPDDTIFKNIAYDYTIRCSNNFFGDPRENVADNCNLFTQDILEILKPDIIICTNYRAAYQICSNRLYADSLIVGGQPIPVLSFWGDISYHTNQMAGFTGNLKRYAEASKGANYFLNEMQEKVKQYESKIWRTILDERCVGAKYDAIQKVEECINATKAV